MVVNAAERMIHDRLSLVKAAESNTKPAVNVLSNAAKKQQMAQIADTFNKNNGTEIPLPTLKGKFGQFTDKALGFLKANKKAFAIGAAVVAGLATVGLIAKKVIDNKNQK